MKNRNVEFFLIKHQNTCFLINSILKPHVPVNWVSVAGHHSLVEITPTPIIPNGLKREMNITNSVITIRIDSIGLDIIFRVQTFEKLNNFNTNTVRQVFLTVIGVKLVGNGDQPRNLHFGLVLVQI